MSDLNDWVESLKRAVAPPGQFDTYYPDSTDDDLLGSLLDAYGECQLDGFFTTGWELADSGVITPDITRGQAALLVIFAGVRILQTQLMNLRNEQKYEAAGAIFEVKTSSNVLTSILKQMNDRKKELIVRLRTNSASSAFSMADAYILKAVGTPFTLSGYDRAYDYNLPYGDW